MIQRSLIGAGVAVCILAGCKSDKPKPTTEPGPQTTTPTSTPPPLQSAPDGPRAKVEPDTCSGTWPAYWQDPDAKFAGMWAGEKVSNQPPANWTGPVFRLSDRFPAKPVDDSGAQPWRATKYDALFNRATPQAQKTTLAREYIWEVMRYIQAGNIDGPVEKDWTLCNNKVRNWYHMPFQTYDVLSGREFVHGLTREAPVTFSLAAVKNPDGTDTLNTTMWAVGFYNPTAAHTLGQVWKTTGEVALPGKGLLFDEGAVIGKLLFNTSSSEQFPVLQNMPEWTANISDPSFCHCTPPDDPKKKCSMAQQSKQCVRVAGQEPPPSQFPKLRLLQFDIAVKDSRATNTGWVFGTFVADGRRKASEPNPWNRIAPLGLMWGNDTPPDGKLAINTPADPRKNGFADEVIFWDAVDELNSVGGKVVAKKPGHLGCNSRLNGPADNANSSCMSCHMTASLPDENLATPPIVAQFGGITPECVQPDTADPTKGTDASGAAAAVVDGIGFAAMDAIYFADTRCGQPVNMMAQTASGPRNVLGNQPAYAGGQKTWVALDYSLQMSQALTQWGEYQRHVRLAEEAAEGTQPVRMFEAVLPGR